MKSLLLNPIARALVLSLLGIVAVLLPWFQLTIFGHPTYICGIHSQAGKIAAILFAALAISPLLSVLYLRKPRWFSLCTIAVGAITAIIAGQYMVSILFPAPTRIEVHEGGAAAQAVANDLVNGMDGRLSIGAPLMLVVSLALIFLGAFQWKDQRSKLTDVLSSP